MAAAAAVGDPPRPPAQLVEYDDEGRPYTVRYRLLTPLLLNELLAQRRLVEEQAVEIARLRDAAELPPRGDGPPG